MKILPNNLRPLCPVCKEYLELVKVQGYRNSEIYWYCTCLISLETAIDCEHIKPDMNIDLEE